MKFEQTRGKTFFLFATYSVIFGYYNILGPISIDWRQIPVKIKKTWSWCKLYLSNNCSTFLISFSVHNLMIYVGIKISRKMQQLPFRKKNATIIYYHPLHFILSTYEKISSNQLADEWYIGNELSFNTTVWHQLRWQFFWMGDDVAIFIWTGTSSSVKNICDIATMVSKGKNIAIFI